MGSSSSFLAAFFTFGLTRCLLMHLLLRAVIDDPACLIRFATFVQVASKSCLDRPITVIKTIQRHAPAISATVKVKNFLINNTILLTMVTKNPNLVVPQMFLLQIVSEKVVLIVVRMSG